MNKYYTRLLLLLQKFYKLDNITIFILMFHIIFKKEKKKNYTVQREKICANSNK